MTQSRHGKTALGGWGLSRKCIGNAWNENSDLVVLSFLMLTLTSEWTGSRADAEILWSNENNISGLRFQSAVTARHVVQRKVVGRDLNEVPSPTIGLSDDMGQRTDLDFRIEDNITAGILDFFSSGNP